MKKMGIMILDTIVKTRVVELYIDGEIITLEYIDSDIPVDELYLNIQEQLK